MGLRIAQYHIVPEAFTTGWRLLRPPPARIVRRIPCSSRCGSRFHLTGGGWFCSSIRRIGYAHYVMNKLGVTDIDVAVIVLASGSRLGEPVPKAAVEVGGKTLLPHALQGVHDSGVADMTVVTLPPNCSETCPQLYDDANRFGAMVSTGGDTRTASVVACSMFVAADPSPACGSDS